jgi:hypothetical protein
MVSGFMTVHGTQIENLRYGRQECLRYPVPLAAPKYFPKASAPSSI